MSTIKVEPSDNLDLSRLLHVFKFLNEARETSIILGEPVSVELNSEEYQISYDTDTQQLAEEIQSIYNDK